MLLMMSKPAFKTDYGMIGENGKEFSRSIVYYLIDNNVSYQVVLTTIQDIDKYPEYLPLFQKMVNTFKISRQQMCFD